MSDIIVGGFPSGGFYTKDEIRGYKAYTALLTQTGSNPPVATEIENTLGAPAVFTYLNTGIYRLTFTGLSWNENKIIAFIGQSDNNGAGVAYCFTTSSSNITLGSYDYTGAASNNILDKTSIEIRIYF